MAEEKQSKVKNKPIKPVIKVLYNGKDASVDFSKYLASFTFKEFEDEQSDEINILLNNNDGYFTDLWYPEKQDKLAVTIEYGADIFELGTFTIDENSFDFSTAGDMVTIKALATSINFSVRTQKIKNWSGYTLNKIADEIGKNYGFKVLGNQGNVGVGTIVQKNESDIAFLKRISKLYGYIFNIKDGYLTFISSDELEGSEALINLSKSTDIESLNLTDTTAKIYGKCQIQYMDLKTKTIKSYTATVNDKTSDTLHIYKRCASFEEAQRIALYALKNSAREVFGNVVLSKPNKSFMAGINCNITGIGKFEGKFHVKSHTIKIDTNGFKQEGEIIRCLNTEQWKK